MSSIAIHGLLFYTRAFLPHINLSMSQLEVKQVQVFAYPDGRMDTCNASKYTGLSEKTLAMGRCNGDGPKFIKRGRVFYFQSDLDEWLNASGRMTSTAQAKALAKNLSAHDCEQAA